MAWRDLLTFLHCDVLCQVSDMKSVHCISKWKVLACMLEFGAH